MMALTGQFSAASRIFSTVSPSGFDRLRLPLLVEHEDLWGNGLAHGIADTHIMINRDSDFSSP